MTKRDLIKMLSEFDDEQAVMLVVQGDSMPDVVDVRREYSWAIWKAELRKYLGIAIIAC